MPTAGALFRTFLHLGFTAFGGLAMIEPLRRRIVEEKGWLTHKEFYDGLAFCQFLPGATVVQLATYIGQRLGGAGGALAGALGFILPAFLLMTALSYLYLQYGHLPWIQTLSRGFNAVVIALLFQTCWRLGREIRTSLPGLAIAGLTVILLWFHLHYLAVFLTAGILGALFEGKKPGPEAPAPLPLNHPDPGYRHLGPLAALVGASAALWLYLRQAEPLLAKLAALMLKVGLLSFGGGYVMIPLLQWELVEHLGWLSQQQFLDGILLGYATPGPILILATFVGYVAQGLKGAVLATLYIFIAPILLVLGLSPFYQRVKEGPAMGRAIRGILAGLTGMLALLTVQLGVKAITDGRALALMVGAAVALLGFKVNLLVVLALAGLLSLLMF